MFVVLPVYFAQRALKVNFIHASHFQVLHATTRSHEHERQMTGNCSEHFSPRICCVFSLFLLTVMPLLQPQHMLGLCLRMLSHDSLPLQLLVILFLGGQ